MKKNSAIKITVLIFLSFLVFVSVSCATKMPETPVLTKYDDLFFWKIEGTDAKGQLSRIFVLGTIHVGDERLYPIPEEITKAYGSAERVYGEISTDGWKSLMIKTSNRMSDSKKEAALIEEERGYAWFDTLTEEQQAFLINKIGKQTVEGQKSNMPWVINNLFSNVTTSNTGLYSNYSYDMHFIEVSNNFGITMLGLDEVDVQLDILDYGDIDFQLEVLTNAIDELLEDPESANKEVISLYEAYLTGSEEKISEVLFSDMESEIKENPEMEGYYNTLFLDRNTNWAETFSQLLHEGGDTFVFAGCGHFVGKDSVFEIMKTKGDLVF